MADNGMTVPGANKAALEAVTTGEVGILVAGVDYNAYSSKNKGEPLDIYYPAGGTIVNPRPAMILKTAPNMDNAKVFVDYLFSDEHSSWWQMLSAARPHRHQVRQAQQSGGYSSDHARLGQDDGGSQR